MLYYEMMFDDRNQDSWELEIGWEAPNGEWLNVWAFTRCEFVRDPQHLCVKISDAGNAVDFSLANFNIPIISRRLGDLLDSTAMDQIQRIPIVVENERNWEILNVLSSVDCLDHEQSVIDYYSNDSSGLPPSDAPDKRRRPRGVRLLRIDGARANELHIFRVSDWPIPIIVSANLKAQCDAAGITGVRFHRVS